MAVSYLVVIIHCFECKEFISLVGHRPFREPGGAARDRHCAGEADPA